MARLVLTNASVIINSVDLSNRVQSVTVNMSKDKVDATAMTASGHEYLAGLSDDSFEVTWRQDFAASSVDATLYPLYSAGSAFLMKVSAAGTTYSATNPVYQGTVTMFEYAPIAGAVGDVLDAPTTFAMANGGAITRGTS